MFHNDLQTQVPNQWKRTDNEHPIEQILTTYSHSNNQLKTSPVNRRRSNTYRSETKHIIQRQRVIRSFLNKSDDIEPSIRKPMILQTDSKALSITSIPSPQLLFAELNEQLPNSNNNNNRPPPIKKEPDRQSPILVRRHRPSIENLTPIQQVSDITNLSGNQLTLTMPAHFTFRNRSSRARLLSERSFSRANDGTSSPSLKPMNYSKAINDNSLKPNGLNSKAISFLSTHVWIPTLSDQSASLQYSQTGMSRSKSNLSRQVFTRHQPPPQSERIRSPSKIKYIQDLYISPRSMNPLPPVDVDINKKISKKGFSFDEWEDLKSSSNGISDNDESMSGDGNGSTTTSNFHTNAQHSNHSSFSPVIYDQHSLFSTPSLYVDNSKLKVPRVPTRRKTSRRRAYNLALPPVAEHLDDEETDTKKILVKISAIENDDSDEQDSLTFQLLNQQETDFEKKSRQLQFKQK